MKKIALNTTLFGVATIVATLSLVACGDSNTTETVVEKGATDIVASVAELPKCTAQNEGEQIFVKEDGLIRFCSDGKWYAVAGGESSSCSTEDLKDSSGIKIICNGDSVGVVLNGVKGDRGEQGIQGIQGVKGDKGNKGDKGDSGFSPYVFLNKNGTVTTAVIKGGEWTLHYTVEFTEDIKAPIFAFTVKNIRGTEITGTNSMFEKAFLSGVKKGEKKKVTFTQNMDLQGGEYLLSLGVTGYEDDKFQVYHRLYDVLNVTVVSDKDTVGYYDMNSKVVVE